MSEIEKSIDLIEVTENMLYVSDVILMPSLSINWYKDKDGCSKVQISACISVHDRGISDSSISYAICDYTPEGDGGDKVRRGIEIIKKIISMIIAGMTDAESKRVREWRGTLEKRVLEHED